ncbi:MAG: hypothetical protein IPP72_13240 [Chitinophagaceae bacterium]|nr:hypothetical protein [Chitinophagaceae bacterium]
MKKKLYNFFVLLVFATAGAEAQTAGYHYQAPVIGNPADEFYNIVLTPEINAHVKTDYSDLRIVNDSGKWVPHLVRIPNNEIVKDAVTRHRKILKKAGTKVLTEIITEGNGKEISNLVFTLKNAVTERYCTLTGSDDLKSWFIINDSIRIITVKRDGGDISDFELRFPPVSYKYFKISINNNGKEPLNIIHAGTIGVSETPGRFRHYPAVNNPTCTLFQKDSAKISFIRVEQSAPFHFETIALKLSGVKYYNRMADLYFPVSVHHSFSNPGRLVQSFTVSNNSTLQFRVPVSNAKTFYILIRNEDNLPLKVDDVKTLFDYRVATVYLERSNNYKLLLDNAGETAANYDLSLEDIPLRDSISQTTIGNITALPTTAGQVQPQDNSPKIIWLTIGLAAIALGFFTYRLLTDMSRSKS